MQYVYNMEVLKDRIHTIENGKQIISPEDFLHQILNSLPSQYDGLAEQLQQDINRKDPELGRYFNLSKPYPLTKMEGSEEVVDEEELKIKRRAYDELLMSMSNATNHSEIAFHIVTYTKDIEGERDNREGFRKLLERYEPKTSLEKGKLMKKFYSASCEYKEDPVQYCWTY